MSDERGRCPCRGLTEPELFQGYGVPWKPVEYRRLPTMEPRRSRFGRPSDGPRPVLRKVSA